MPPLEFYEFFAGGGMVRAGLGRDWRCTFANDFDLRKTAAYRANWGDGGELTVGDITTILPDELPGRADLMWGSFPCQDLSVAGRRAGLDGERSGAFRPFWNLVVGLAEQGRAPRIVAVENVRGTLTAAGGRDFAAICAAFAETGYRFGAMVIDAALFLPQSRPRLFIVGVAPDVEISADLVCDAPHALFSPDRLVQGIGSLPPHHRRNAIWWRLPSPGTRNVRLVDVMERELLAWAWNTPARTARLLALMAPIHHAKVEAMKSAGGLAVGAVYRRTRRALDGASVQRAEVRFDGLAGCLRTPGGGSSRQTVLVIEDGMTRSRLLTPRETARLMGLADSYRLPANANEAYHLTGDGVATPVVRYLTERLFEPLLVKSVAKATLHAFSGGSAPRET